MRASELYTEDYARRYREHDETLWQGTTMARPGKMFGELCRSFGGKISVLDLGCGTGRYFWCLENVGELVGIDASRPMLDQARHPVEAHRITAEKVTLIEGDFCSYVFNNSQFELIYSIGVLAEHTSFDRLIVEKVHSWLKPGGFFFFTTVHPHSFSVRQTLRRWLGGKLLPFTVGTVRSWLRDRLLAGGLYADEERIRKVLIACGFQIERLEMFSSEVHLHCLCVAQKA